jgi:excisionase family DNA binding protein
MDLITARQLADRLNVSVGSVRAWTNEGRIPVAARVGSRGRGGVGEFRYDYDEVREALAPV